MAGRYATALFELARDANAIDAVKADLERFDALVAESPISRGWSAARSFLPTNSCTR